MSIDELIIKDNIPDKPQAHATTTHKFKKDFWNFFNKDFFKNVNFIEFGTSTGYTAKIASYLFEHVHTVNIKINNSSERYLSSRENITCYGFDLYSETKKWLSIPSGDVFFIDAVHNYKAVRQDIQTALTKISSKKGKKYLVFDDYGAYPEVKQAIDDAKREGILKEVSRLGESTGYKYGESTADTSRILTDSEGIICREV